MSKLSTLLSADEFSALCQTLSLARESHAATLNTLVNYSALVGNHHAMISSGIVSIVLTQFCCDRAPREYAVRASRAIQSVCCGIHASFLPPQFRRDLLNTVTAVNKRLPAEARGNLLDAAAAVLASQITFHTEEGTRLEVMCLLEAAAKSSPISPRVVKLVSQLSESHEVHDVLLCSGILPRIVQDSATQNPEMRQIVRQCVLNIMKNPVAALKMYDMHLLGTRALDNMGGMGFVELLLPSSPPASPMACVRKLEVSSAEKNGHGQQHTPRTHLGWFSAWLPRRRKSGLKSTP
jgi:hypothetical protein